MCRPRPRARKSRHAWPLRGVQPPPNAPKNAGNPFGLAASDGSRFLDLTNCSAGAPCAGMTQTFATLAGATYTLSFDLGGSNGWGRPDGLSASAAGTSRVFTTGASTTLTLQGNLGFNYIGLDNVSVVLAAGPVPAIPEPATWAFMLVGFAACGLASRRRVRASTPRPA